VDLTQGAGCLGDRVERGEQLAGRSTEFFFEGTQNLIGGERPDMFLELRKLRDDRGRDQIGPRAQDLSEFDERRTQVFERPAKAAGTRLVVLGEVPLPQYDAPAPPQIAVQSQLLNDVAEAVFQEHGGNLAAAAEVTQETKRMRFRKHVFSHPAENIGEPKRLTEGTPSVMLQHSGRPLSDAYITEK
jgi:hypothetical protein